MNQNQKKYALNRIDALVNIKLRDAENKFTQKAVIISQEVKYKLIASGEVEIKPWSELRSIYRPDLYLAYDFSAYEKPEKLDKTKYEPIKKKVSKLAQDAKDQIMLGDCKEALKLIADLESIVVIAD